MIRIAFNPTFEQDVSIAVPGKELPETAKFTFRALTNQQVYPLVVISGQSRVGWIGRQWEFAKMCLRCRTWVSAVDILDELIVSWGGFDVEYSKEHLRMLLLRYPSAKASIFFSFFAGLKEARLKN